MGKLELGITELGQGFREMFGSERRIQGDTNIRKTLFRGGLTLAAGIGIKLAVDALTHGQLPADNLTQAAIYAAPFVGLFASLFDTAYELDRYERLRESHQLSKLRQEYPVVRLEVQKPVPHKLGNKEAPDEKGYLISKMGY